MLFRSDDLVRADSEGNYQFIKSDDNLSSYDVTVGNFAMSVGTLVTEEFNVRSLFSSSSANKQKTTRVGEEVSFSYKVADIEYDAGSVPAEIDSVVSATTNELIDITLNFENCAVAGLRMQTMELVLPQIIEYGTPILLNSIDGTIVLDGNILRLENASLSSSIRLRLPIVGLKPANIENSATEKWNFDKNARTIDFECEINASGSFDTDIATTTAWMTANPTLPVSIRVDFEFPQMKIISVTGLVEPDVDFDISPIEFTGIPDFLNDDEVKLDVSNPQIYLTVKNETPATIDVNGILRAYKNGKNIATVEVGSKYGTDAIVFQPEVEQTICLSRKSVSGTNNVIVSNLGSLITTIPDEVTFDIDANPEPNKVLTIDLGKTYTIKPSFEVVAPLAFGDAAEIVYKDTIDGWNKDIVKNGIELKDKQNGCLEVTAEIESQVPLDLNFTAVAINEQGEVISGVEVFIVDGTIIKSGELNKPTTTSVMSRLTERTENGIKQLDGLALRAEGKSGDLTDVPLNQKQFIRVKEMRITLKGGLIVDLN